MQNGSCHHETDSNHDPRFRRDYERLLPQIRRVRADELVPITIDVQQAVAIALGAWPEIRTYRAMITKQAPQFDIARFDDYEAHARAVGHAHTLYMNVVAPSGNLPPLAQTALVLRDQLLADAGALAKRGLINGARLKGLKGPAGFRYVAYDLLVLTTLIRESWGKITGKTAIELEELAAAESLAAQLLNEVDLSAQIPALVSAAAEIRQQAFTLFVYGHDQVRRVLSFIRWNHGDVDEIAPPLCGKGTHAKRDVPRPQPRSVSVPDRTTAPERPTLRLDIDETLLSIPGPSTVRTSALASEIGR